MRWMLLVLLLGCSSETPLPGGTEKWVAALDAVCSETTVEPRPGKFLGYRCTPLADLTHPEAFDFGGVLHLDNDGALRRIELDMRTTPARAVDAIHRVLIRYGAAERDVKAAVHDDHEQRHYKTRFASKGLQIFVLRQTGDINGIQISITAS